MTISPNLFVILFYIASFIIFVYVDSYYYKVKYQDGIIIYKEFQNSYTSIELDCNSYLDVVTYKKNYLIYVKSGDKVEAIICDETTYHKHKIQDSVIVESNTGCYTGIVLTQEIK